MAKPKLTELVIDALEDIKARDIKLINVSEITSVSDYIAIASGDSNRQTRALAKNVSDKVKDAGYKIYGSEGEDTGEWVLVDCGDVVVHIMQPAVREYYKLEELWVEGKIEFPKPKRALKPVPETVASGTTKITRKKPVSKQVAAKKPAAKPSAAKKPAAKKTTVKKPIAKTVPVKKVATKKPVAKPVIDKAEASKTPTAKKSPSASVTTTAGAKKVAAKKPAVKKPAAKKPAAKKPAAKKPAAKKPALKKLPAKKAAAKKVAVK